MSFYDSQNKQQLFPCNSLDQFMFVMETCVFYAVGIQFLNI
jgi:hypothetical protein